MKEAIKNRPDVESRFRRLARVVRARHDPGIMKFFLLSLLFFASVTALPAQDNAPSVPASNSPHELLEAGFEQYRQEGAAAAVKTWLEKSPLGSDEKSRAELLAVLKKVEDVYGQYIGWERAGFRILSPSVQRWYLVAGFERGPLFAGSIATNMGGGELCGST